MADDEPTGGIDTDFSISIGGSATGEIEVEGDIDYFAVQLQAGVTYQFDLEGALTGGGTLDDPFIEGLFDSNNVQVVDSNDDGGVRANSRIIYTPTVSGTYYFAVTSFDNTGDISVEQDDVGTYTVYVEEQSKFLRPDPVEVAIVPAAGNDFIDSIAAGIVYEPDADGTTRVTYSIPDANSTFLVPFDEEDNDLTETFVPISSAAVGYYEDALGKVSDFANIEFERVADEGTQFGVLRLSGTSGTVGRVLGVGGFPSERLTGGDIFVFEHRIDDASFAQWVIIHELGHTLGLTHIGNARAEAPDGVSGTEYTQMTPQFQSAFFSEASSVSFYSTTFGYLDMLALRHLYGADDSKVSGNNTYTFDLSKQYSQTIFDTGGTDSIVITGSGKDVAIDLTPNSDHLNGAFINVGTTITYFDSGVVVGTRKESVFLTPETVIENVTTADGDDLLVGNKANNFLDGNAGADTINGADGDDTLFGRAGDDVFAGGKGNDFISGGAGDDIALGGDGNDRIFGGPDDQGNDVFAGGAGDDEIGGAGGDDFIIGGGLDDGVEHQLTDQSDNAASDGKDTLYGGDGNDTILGGGWKDDLVDDNGRFDASEQRVSGTDDNVIWAGHGDDLVYGAAGADIIGGRDGSDTIYAGDGDDTVFGGASDHGDDISGGKGNDVLYSGAGNDLVDGGDGADELHDGKGNDTYTGGEGADTFLFVEGGGNDEITDFAAGEDILNLSGTVTKFSSSNDVRLASTLATKEGVSGISLDLGGGDTVFLSGLTMNNIVNLEYIF